MSWGGWIAPFGVIMWILVITLIVLGIVWLFHGTTGRSAGFANRSPTLDVLEEGYARGQIKQDEYLGKKRDLRRNWQRRISNKSEGAIPDHQNR